MGFDVCKPLVPEYRQWPGPRAQAIQPLILSSERPDPPVVTQERPDIQHRHTKRFHTAFDLDLARNNTKWPADVCAARDRIEAELAKLEAIMKNNWEHKRREWVQQSNIAIAET